VLPFLMFVFLMALGSDYNVLVMTRIREESHHATTRQAVRRAIGATGTAWVTVVGVGTGAGIGSATAVALVRQITAAIVAVEAPITASRARALSIISQPPPSHSCGRSDVVAHSNNCHSGTTSAGTEL